MLVATNRISERHVVHYAPIERAAADLRVALSASHLWLEEHLTGDPRVSLERDVWGQLDHADALARALLQGNEGGGGLPANEALSDPLLRQRVEDVRTLLGRFRRLTRTRLERPATSGVGSAIDQRYDDVFRRLMVRVEDLESSIGSRMFEGRQRANVLFAFILISWLLLLALTMATLHHRENQQRKAEEALDSSEAQLRQAQKLEAVGQLAGGLAHDVNNYLATINAQCGLVKVLHADQPGIASLMDEVIATVGKTTSLLQRLLAFSRRQPVNRQVLDLNLVTAELGSMMRRLLSDDVELRIVAAPDLWPVEADPSQLEQVLVNLLVNAREAMPQGGRVTVETRNADVGSAAARKAGVGPGQYAVLTVRDEGSGIDEEVQEKIFDPFFSTKERGAHSGLGLATVYGIVQQSGGFLHLDSEVGKGTTFQVYLPRTHRQPEEREEPQRAAVSALRHRGRVLVVEDNADLRRVCTAVLAAVGHEVESAADGSEGLRRMDESTEPYDVVITDLVMPGSSGRAVAEHALGLSERTRVVLVSGFRDHVLVEELVASERVRYLDKPFSPDRLLATLDELLSAAAAPPGAVGTGQAG